MEKVMEQIKQRLQQLEADYAKLCMQLGNVRANRAKLEATETQILQNIDKLDKEAGLLKQSLAPATKKEDTLA